MLQKNNVIDCYNKTANAYSDLYFNELDNKPLDRLLLRSFAQELKGKFVDLGCGCGHTTRFLYEAGATDILGVDLSAQMVEVASQKNKDYNIPFWEDNILKSTLSDNAYTGVVAFYAIVHFTYEELELAFKEIYRITKPKGQFLFSFHVGENSNVMESFLGETVDVAFHFFIVDKVLDLLKKTNWTVADALVRHPYEGKEYPSQRAYIRCVKN